MLWEMLIGNSLFRGSPAELVHQHQHAALPLKQLQGVPQPLVVLLKLLLEKDPRRRVQTPGELLKQMPAIRDAIDTKQTITPESLGQTPEGDSGAVVRKQPAKPKPEKISLAKLPVTGSDILGREQDVAFLDDVWENPGVNVVTIVAWAGVGKSTLINHWLRRMATQHYRSAQIVYGWSFYPQGSSGGTSSADEFLTLL